MTSICCGYLKSTQDIGVYCAFTDNVGSQKDTHVLHDPLSLPFVIGTQKSTHILAWSQWSLLLRVLNKVPKMLGCPMYYWQHRYSKRYLCSHSVAHDNHLSQVLKKTPMYHTYLSYMLLTSRLRAHVYPLLRLRSAQRNRKTLLLRRRLLLQ